MSDIPHDTSAASVDDEATRRRKRLILAVCCAAQFLVILDLSIVNVALPTIQTALTISSVDLQWIVDAYAILFAGFLMLAGRATDLIGQRRTFVGALGLFGLASLVGGLAQSSDLLIAARAGQGLAGAGMAAASLAVITSTFAPGPERHRAIALWGSMNGLGGAVGMLAGGVLTEALSWRWILLVNVPIALAGAVMAARVLNDRRRDRDLGFDLVGSFVLTSGLLIATYGGVTAGKHGFGSAEALVPIGVGSALLTLFPLVESRVRSPLVPPGVVSRRLWGVNLIVLLFSASLFAMWFAASLYLQQVLALGALDTGLIFLPMALAIMLAARPAGRLASRVGVRPVLGGGLVMLAVGLLLMSRVADSGSALQYIALPGLLVSFGIALSVVASTIAATQTAKADEAGLASGLVNTARQVGGGLGLAVLLSIASQHTASKIGDAEPVREALTDGFALAFQVGAGLVAVAAVLTFVLLPRASDAPSRAGGRRVLAGAAATVAVFVALEVGLPRSEGDPIGAFTTDGALSFVTEPGLHPPEMFLERERTAKEPLPGPIMTGNFVDLTKGRIVGQSGPLMLDDALQPVWFRPSPIEDVAGNLDVHTYRGKPVLSWWEGEISETGEIDHGRVNIVDQAYRPIATLEGRDGWVIALHDIKIVDDVAWVAANRNELADLSDVGGVTHGVIIDSALQAYDIETGRLLYTWQAKDHIPMEESDTQPPTNGFPWDAYHINSIELVDGDRALVSMRNTNAGYLFDRKTGRIEWTLGGKGSTFEMDPDAEFEWQHDMEMEDERTVRLFDNHCCRITGAGDYLPSDRSSRVLTLTLDHDAKTARVKSEQTHGDTFRAQYMGNAQRLDSGGLFVGWGQVPYISEYDADGELVFDGAFPAPNISYRARTRPWVGRPATPPKGAARTSGGRTTAYASWNGATEVVRWRVVDAAGRTVARADRDGFETEIPLPRADGPLRVRALDADGEVLGTSRPFTATASSD
ncbi:MAG: MFS transporter [Solirubrobacteraceae bacterium]|nr:MFS transporter [Solirubrobacteraceae bacterium]